MTCSPRVARVGYRHLEGVALRLLGELLVSSEPAAALEALESAQRILEALDARNDVAKTLAARAAAAQASGAPDQARAFLNRALAIFDDLGARDEPLRARAMLTTLGPTTP